MVSFTNLEMKKNKEKIKNLTRRRILCYKLMFTIFQKNLILIYQKQVNILNFRDLKVWYWAFIYPASFPITSNECKMTTSNSLQFVFSNATANQVVISNLIEQHQEEHCPNREDVKSLVWMLNASASNPSFYFYIFCQQKNPYLKLKKKTSSRTPVEVVNSQIA